MQVVNKIKMDLLSKQNVQTIHAVSGDTDSRRIQISLLEGGIPWDVPTGSNVAIAYLAANGANGVYDTLPDGKDASIYNGNQISITLIAAALIPGTTKVTIVISDSDGKQISTFPLNVEVDENYSSQATEPENYINLRQVIAAEVEALLDGVSVTEGGSAYYFNVNYSEDNYVSDKGFSDLVAAYNKGRALYCVVNNNLVLALVNKSSADMVFQSINDRRYFRVTITSEDTVIAETDDYALLTEVPDKPPNPNALTINGAAYDGSAPVTVDTREFLVTATGTPDAGYTADKPYEEVLAAYEGGRTVICVLNGGMAANFRLPLIMASDGVLAFAMSPVPGTIFMVSLTPSGCMVSESISTMTIGDQEWDFDGPVDFTDTINGMINAKVGELENGKSAYEIAVDHGFEGSEEEWLASLKGSVSDGDTLLGQTPLTMTEDASVKLVGSGTHSYTVKGKTVADLSTMTVTSTNATLTEHEDHIEIVAGEAANWYGAYVTLTVKGLTVGKTYVCVIDQLGLDTANLINNGYYMVKNSSGTELARMGNDTTGLNSVEFTPDTSGITITCYPCNNYYWGQNYRTAHIGDLYINEAADGTQRSAIINKSGSFTGSFALGQVSAGVTITAEPACEVFRVSSDNEPVLPLAGKTVVCFGDSLFGMYRGDTSAPAYIAQKTGATVYNVGFGGCRMSAHPTSGYAAFSMWALAKAVAQNSWTDQDEQAVRGSSYFTEQLALLKSIDFSQVDAIVIHYGTNDFTAGSTGGAIDNAEKPQDVNTLCGAMRYSITALLTAYPHLRIFVSVPAFRYWTAEDGTITYSDTYANGNGNKLTDFVDAIANTAKEYNLPVIDSYYSLGINKINAATFLGDGVHHNEAGRKRFGEYIGSCILAGY